VAGSKHKSQDPDAITVAAVREYARDLCHQAELARARDPFADPYAPSRDTAEKLSRQLGPAAALTELARRARSRELVAEEQGARASASRRAHQVHQLKAVGERVAESSRLSLGERLDRALAGLRMLSEAPTGRLDAEPVKGGDGAAGVPWLDSNVAAAVREDAKRVVERAERELEGSRRRLVETEVAA
jgi:hypothetical protein